MLAVVQQKPTQYRKAITLQFKKKRIKSPNPEILSTNRRRTQLHYWIRIKQAGHAHCRESTIRLEGQEETSPFLQGTLPHAKQTTYYTCSQGNK